jgi:hypothetical protein
MTRSSSAKAIGVYYYEVEQSQRFAVLMQKAGEALNEVDNKPDKE